MKKINIIGTSGSGKSTFARKLSKQLQFPYLEIDAIFWGKDWYWPSDEEFFADLKNALDKEEWVLDGNYTRTTFLKWETVDTVIWIDFSFIRTLYQVTTRSIRNLITKKELWPGTGNRQTIQRFFSKDSIVLSTIKVYRRNRLKYLKMMDSSEYAHIHFIHLRSPRECSQFLNEMNPRQNS